MCSCSGPKAAGAANHSEPETVPCLGICQMVKDPTSHTTTYPSALPVELTKWPKALEITISAEQSFWSHSWIKFKLWGHQSKCTHSIKDVENCSYEVFKTQTAMLRKKKKKKILKLKYINYSDNAKLVVYVFILLYLILVLANALKN